MTRRKRRNADALRPDQISTTAAAIRHTPPQQHNYAPAAGIAEQIRHCEKHHAVGRVMLCIPIQKKAAGSALPAAFVAMHRASPSRHLARLQLAELPKPEAPLKWRGSLIFKDQSVTVELHICGACFTIFVLRKDQLGFITAIIIIRITIDKNHAIKVLLY